MELRHGNDEKIPHFFRGGGWNFLPAAIAAAALCTGCGNQRAYAMIEQTEAVEMMEQQKDCLLVDVRTQEEYQNGHIPNSLLLPVEEIREGSTKGLGDKDQVLLLYCRTGRRAEDAAAILCEEGFTNVFVMGGILEWTGEVTTEEGSLSVGSETEN